MLRFHVQRLSAAAPAAPDVAGTCCTISLPDPPPELSVWSDLLTWLRNNPEIILAVITAILGLFPKTLPATPTAEKLP